MDGTASDFATDVQDFVFVQICTQEETWGANQVWLMGANAGCLHQAGQEA